VTLTKLIPENGKCFCEVFQSRIEVALGDANIR
jgi:hypothetical protein